MLANVKSILEVFTRNDQVIPMLIVSLNIHRRHLSESQFVLIAATLNVTLIATTSHSVTRFVTRNEPKTTKHCDSLRRYETRREPSDNAKSLAETGTFHLPTRFAKTAWLLHPDLRSRTSNRC